MDTKPADLAAIAQVFNADFAHRAVHPGDGRDLVWSPTDSQAQILALINGARKSLRIYSEEMGDATIEDALIKAAQRGVDVRVCGENTGGEYDSDFSRLAAGGVHISYYSSSHGFYIHGKVDRGRLRHQPRPGVRRLRELLQHLAQPQPRTRPDHRQPEGDVLDRQHVRRRLPKRQALVVAATSQRSGTGLPGTGVSGAPVTGQPSGAQTSGRTCTHGSPLSKAS